MAVASGNEVWDATQGVLKITTNERALGGEKPGQDDDVLDRVKSELR